MKEKVLSPEYLRSEPAHWLTTLPHALTPAQQTLLGNYREAWQLSLEGNLPADARQYWERLRYERLNDFLCSVAG